MGLHYAGDRISEVLKDVMEVDEIRTFWRYITRRVVEVACHVWLLFLMIKEPAIIHCQRAGL